MSTLLTAMISTGFLSAALLWSVGFLWQVLKRAADLGTSE